MNTTAAVLIEWDGGWATVDTESEVEPFIAAMLKDWAAKGDPGERSDFKVSPNGPGAYGGPAEERIANPAERHKLKAAGWRECRIKTLWLPPVGKSGVGASNVDEALAVLASEVHKVHLKRDGKVLLDGEEIGSIKRGGVGLYTAKLTDGTVLVTNAADRPTAVGAIYRTRLGVGERVKHSGGLTGGPYTLA